MATTIYSYPPPSTAIYATVQQVKYAINAASNTPGVDPLNNADDSLILWFAEAASRSIDGYCKRRFYPHIQTFKYDWRGQTIELVFGDDLISLTTLTNGNGAVIAATGSNNLANYFLYPTNFYPKFKLQLAINQGLAWTYTNTPQQCISVLGVWGEPSDPVTGAYNAPIAGCTMVNAQGATDTSFVVPANTVSLGQTLYFSAGTEFVLVTGIQYGANGGNDTLTVSRGMFGSTAASILQNAQVNTVIYRPEIVKACYRLAAYYYRQKDSQIFDTTVVPQLGQIKIPGTMPRDICDELDRFYRYRMGYIH